MLMTNKVINLKVLVVDSDFFALQALNSYLAWDRRTRVVALVNTVQEAIEHIQSVADAERPDVIVLEAEIFSEAGPLRAAIQRFRQMIKNVMVFCLALKVEPAHVAAAIEAGARGYLLRNEIRLQIVGAICYALDHEFVVTGGVQTAGEAHLSRMTLIPSERLYPEMTERIRQALYLYVVEGMPAQLAADEMGISPHTIRSYVKEGYRILEAHDETDYPEEMGPLERAFMRFTALNQDRDADDEKPEA
jgi:DNA-binding NarL/FixJ family response regulator